MDGGMMRKVILIAVLVSIFAIGVAAKTFVDWRGEFKIEYPDQWTQVPYEEVNRFLALRGIHPDDFDFDVVLAERGDSGFVDEAYVFVMVEKVGRLNRSQKDSAMAEMALEFNLNSVAEQKVINQPSKEIPINRPLYDSDYNTVISKTIVEDDSKSIVILDMRRFYDNGIAVFICHSPLNEYINNKSVFIKLIKSFSTKNLKEATASDSVHVVDLTERDTVRIDTSDGPAETPSETTPEEATGSTSNAVTYEFIVLAIAVVVLIFVFLVFRKKKK